MKNILLVLFLSFLYATILFGNGVGIVDTESGNFLKLVSTEVNVNVNNQVAEITTMQIFKNETGSVQQIEFAFPLPGEASATQLKWQINNLWYLANMAETQGDSTGGSGSGGNETLTTYLGPTPLFFEIEQELGIDSLLVVELTYVELLDYNFGHVNFFYPNNYLAIQPEYIELQKFQFTLVSDRTITNIQSLNHETTQLANDGNNAFLECMVYETPCNENFEVEYTLSLDELGLFSLSTYLPDTLVPDEHGRGFFVFVAEPDPSENTEVINKVFTLIVDRSGSMSGDKIVQARNAASFIVEHLNEGDKFNIVDFASDVTCFSEEHVEYNTENESTALTYISNFYASGMTNISGAFSEAIPQFSTANDSTANIIIFFTDGEATTGITNTEGILNHVSNLVTQNETEVMIFTFGIGASVNEQLLSLLANQNNGIADFLGNDELEEKITEFYLKIQNPVLLNTNVTFTPSIIDEVYPLPLPNLYKGQQLIMVGRYQEAAPVNVNFSGDAFGQPVSYNYSPSLADSSVSQYQFLPKIWAKRKIEYLLIQYYAADPDSPEAEALEAQIIQISLDYGVISPFTEFSGGEVTAIETEDMENNNVVQKYELLGNFPNPFNPSTSIRFRINSQMNETVYIRIYNSMGQLVKVLSVNVNGQGEYSVLWNGKLENGSLAPSDIYFYVIEFDNAILSGKMVLVK